jgi:hypothetical protein
MVAKVRHHRSGDDQSSIAAKAPKGVHIMKQASEVACATNHRIKPFTMRRARGGANLVLRPARPGARRRIGRTLRITNRVIPVTNSGENAEEVFFPVKIVKRKAADGL